VFPVEDGTLRERLIAEVLDANLADNTRARILQPDGTYVRPTRLPHAAMRRSQIDLLMAARRPAHSETAPPPAAPLPTKGRKTRTPRVTVRRRANEP
jgi:polyphosphate kinase